MSIWRELLSHERMVWREGVRNDPSFWTGTSQAGIVTTAHYCATGAGVEILEAGGNAVDASVAASLALGVAEPAGSGLGGMAMMMIHRASGNRTFALEGPCRAPLRATPEEAAQASRRLGYKAIAVPTNPAVLDYALNKYGTMSIDKLIEPAVKLAEEGYPITPLRYRITQEYLASLAKTNAAYFMLSPDKKPFPPGTIFRQPALARTLRRLGQAGLQDFYTGEIGKRIIEDITLNGGFITAEDFTSIPYPGEKEPLTAPFGDWTVHTLAPPGGGTTLIQMLNLFSELAYNDFNPDTPEAAVLFSALIRRARLDRRKYRPCRPEFVQKDAPDLANPLYAKAIAEELRPDFTGSGETSHLCVMDQYGNVVSLTQSIERSFGAKVVTKDLGFLYNGFMKGFKVENKKHFHYLRPGAVARSNASPTIIFKGKRPAIAIGSTGSERMVSGIFQVLVRLSRGQTPFQAVAAPRLHCTPEGIVCLEAERFSDSSIEALKKKGFELKPYDAWSFQVGGLHLAVFDGTVFTAVAEPRRDGAAAGPD